jgi:pyrroloquinoline quinone (PQQ) biosynthesis protein C
MNWVDFFAELFQAQTDGLTESRSFRRLVEGEATRAESDDFIRRVVKAHLRSPRLLAFLYSLAPPGEASTNLEHNMLEELGIEDETAHPELLRDLFRAVDTPEALVALEAEADEDLKRYTVDPLLYGTLKDVGLAVLAEVSSFEFMLSRVASTIARALERDRGLSGDSLAWFSHHSEVDIEHARQALRNLAAYIAYYRFDDEDAKAIVEGAFRENVFVKRYFGEAMSMSPSGTG